ncbi:hypothetical protein Bequi_09890 [Brachybacterium sp. JHP9]|uniref:Large polyvalent protein associated domain-containing protein n=1 Tax=Brachybacterium equifaecis TaxID=2910770 RepID=A0ABT0R372_9MICO|nr:hypothetical protein [Brachybacterium equifaecis]MCL6423694.1 hypothetical protein [Brachybacterium equifaecis]
MSTSKISGKAASARESARKKDGKFGEQEHQRAEVDLYGDMGWMGVDDFDVDDIQEPEAVEAPEDEFDPADQPLAPEEPEQPPAPEPYVLTLEDRIDMLRESYGEVGMDVPQNKLDELHALYGKDEAALQKEAEDEEAGRLAGPETDDYLGGDGPEQTPEDIDRELVKAVEEALRKNLPKPTPEPEKDGEPEPTSTDAAPAAERPRTFDEYTFLEQFEQMDAKYEQDFDGYPTRFFKADLRGKYLPAAGSPREEEYYLANHATALPQRMYLAVSDTADLKIGDEEAEKLAADCGITDLRRIDPADAKSLRLDSRSWVGTYGGKEVAISSSSAGSKNARGYSFRGRPIPPFTQRAFTHLDLRALAANERIKRRTGVDLLPIVTGGELGARLEGTVLHERYALKKEIQKEHADRVRSVMEGLEDAQLEGRNFQAHRKYMSAKKSSSATAWQDKKHPDAEHVAMARDTTLAKAFTKIEIDNDVDAESYARFESAWEDAKDKLPPIPEGLAPTLRIRKLGRHKATGVFFPHVNTIAVDVRDSSSFVHEYGHYVDVITKDNASLGKNFRSVVGRYSDAVKVPPGTTGKYGADYYSTPTEVYARGFELYAHERLGIDNRLLNPEKFDRFDFEPFKDPSLKEQLFGLFDRAFKGGEGMAPAGPAAHDHEH